MKFIEVEKSIKNKEWSMTDLHSHSHFEIYFLKSGTRRFFIENAMYKISAPCMIVIPPFTMHKTEGVGFSRINVNVSPSSLNNYELNVLKRLSKKVIALSNDNGKTFFPLLEEAEKLYLSEDKFSNEKIYAIFSFLILQMDKLKENVIVPLSQTKKEKVSPLTLKIIDYINSNLNNSITLNLLSKKFFLSQTSICTAFKKAMNCTVGEYILRLRINKSKQLLSGTKKSVEEISTLCGFSSGAYMGLIFKAKVGISPLQYRKLQTTKV